MTIRPSMPFAISSELNSWWYELDTERGYWKPAERCDRFAKRIVAVHEVTVFTGSSFSTPTARLEPIELAKVDPLVAYEHLERQRERIDETQRAFQWNENNFYRRYEESYGFGRVIETRWTPVNFSQ